MSHEEPLRQCIAFSNEGAHMIEKGCMSRAIQTMTIALKLCRSVCGDFASSASSSSSMQDLRFDVDALIQKAYVKENLKMDCADVFVYQHPIHLPRLLGDCRQAVHVVSLVISFNMGLAHHLQALRSGNSMSESYLKRALQFYTAAQNMQRKRCSGSKALFMVALINNMGQIYQSLRQSEMSSAYYNRLLSLIFFMTSYKKADAENYEAFLRNALPRVQACAGAA